MATPGKKPRKQPRTLVPQPHGGALKPGGDGVSGGRPKLEYLEWCRGLLDRADHRAEVETVMKDSKHPAYATMYKEIANRAHGKPKESIDHTVSGEVTVRFARETNKRTAS